MAYETQYKLPYTNQLGELIEIFFQEKDGDVVDPEILIGQFPCLNIEANGNTDHGKDDSIISKTATINIWVQNATSLNHLTFSESTYDAWLIQINQDGTPIFHGWLIPEAGGIQLKDKPYTITVKATDGIGLLKNSTLSDVVGDPFTGRNSIISYLSGALAKNILGLPLRVFCNIYHAGMDDRSDGDHFDMTQQAKLHHRTFLRESGEFVSCYEALEIILGSHFRLYYENGSWVIYRIPEYTQVTNVWYTDYDGGIPQFGFLEDTTAVRVGKSQLIRPVTGDAVLSNEIAIKSAKHVFNFVFPEDLVNNEKLSQLGSLISSDATGENYNVVGWSSWMGVLTAPLIPSSVVPSIRVERNTLGIEIDRYYVVPHDPTSTAYPLDNFIMHDNDDFWVKKNDLLDISVETRMKLDQDDPPFFHNAFLIAILGDGLSGSSLSHWWTLDQNGVFSHAGTNLVRALDDPKDETEWETLAPDKQATIPVDGRLFIWFGTDGVDDGNEAWFRNLRIQYTMVLANGDVKGDYWLRTKNAGHIDTIEEEVKISDALRKSMKGALWQDDDTLTEYNWYRYGTTEERHYKELVNMGYFAHYYRRYLSIEGTFKGIKSDNGITQVPLSLSSRYYFEDDAAIQRNYILVPPFQIDVDRGWFKGKFIEVYRDDDDVNEQGDSAVFNYIF